MAYADLAAMERNFGRHHVVQLTDVEGTGELDAVALAGAFASADAEIDSYVRARYPVPLAQPDLHLVNIACDLTRYHLTKNGALLTEDIKTRRDDGVVFLKRVARGDAALTSTGAADNAPAPSLARFQSGKSMVGRGSLL